MPQRGSRRPGRAPDSGSGGPGLPPSPTASCPSLSRSRESAALAGGRMSLLRSPMGSRAHAFDFPTGPGDPGAPLATPTLPRATVTAVPGLDVNGVAALAAEHSLRTEMPAPPTPPLAPPPGMSLRLQVAPPPPPPSPSTTPSRRDARPVECEEGARANRAVAPQLPPEALSPSDAVRLGLGRRGRQPGPRVPGSGAPRGRPRCSRLCFPSGRFENAEAGRFLPFAQPRGRRRGPSQGPAPPCRRAGWAQGSRVLFQGHAEPETPVPHRAPGPWASHTCSCHGRRGKWPLSMEQAPIAALD